MESRSSNKKVSGTSAIKKPKSDLLRRKTLGRSLRSSVDRRISSKDLPPLTPLHRLRRFKAIRDKNLNKGKTESTQKKSIIKMEEITTTAVVHAEKIIKEEDSEASVLKANIQGSIEKSNCDQEKLESSEEFANSSDVEESISEKKKENSSEEENLVNGHKLQDDKNTAMLSNVPNHEGSNRSTDNRLSSDVSSSHKDVLTAENEMETNSDLAEENYDDAEEKLPNELAEANNERLQESSEKEGSVESDAGSVSSSSSTFPNQLITSSSEDVSGKKSENSEEEEIDVDRLSTKSNDKEKEIEKTEDVKSTQEALSSVLKQSEMPSKIPRSVYNSGSSYKTAFGSSSRISGRRPVGGIYRTRNLKRKAEDEIEPSYSGKRLNSPSQPSPRWTFFRPSISSLWSPRKTLYDFSVTSTPLKNVDDSMAVNIDEESMNCHINDSDLFLDSNKSSLMTKRSRWGCSIM